MRKKNMHLLKLNNFKCILELIENTAVLYTFDWSSIKKSKKKKRTYDLSSRLRPNSNQHKNYVKNTSKS